MMSRGFVRFVFVAALAVSALPSLALAGGRDGGAAGDPRRGRDERGQPDARARRDARDARDARDDGSDAAARSEREEDPRRRRHRQQGKFALLLVGAALGVYVLYKIARP